MQHQVVTDYSNVTENSSVKASEPALLLQLDLNHILTSLQQVYVRSRPPDFSWTQDDDDVVEDKPYQGALQAASQLAGLTPSGSASNLGLSHSSSAANFIEPFP
eukprot:7367-Heterococcus_DN1.PRE.1